MTRCLACYNRHIQIPYGRNYVNTKVMSILSLSRPFLWLCGFVVSCYIVVSFILIPYQITEFHELPCILVCMISARRVGQQPWILKRNKDEASL